MLEELVVFDEIRTDVGEENRRGDRLEGVAVEITLEVSVEFITSDGGFDHPQESGTLFIGDVGQRVVRVAAVQRLVKPGVGIGRSARFLDRLVLGFDAERDLLRGNFLAVKRLDDAPLGVSRHALVEPDVAPRRVGREIARPAVREFMRDEADEALVADDEGRGEKRHVGVFHPPVREGRRQDEHVVTAPAIGSVKRFGGAHHLLAVAEFGGGGVERGWLGPDASAGPE